MNVLVSIVAGFIAGTIFGLTAASEVLPQSVLKHTERYNQREEVMQDNLDRAFIEVMIPHHEGAIAMAMKALERSQRPEILSLAGGIIEAQTNENEQMRIWYTQWFGAEVPAAGDHMMHMNSTEEDLAALELAADFDIAFIDRMIPHHEMAVMMAQMLQTGTQREEMRVLADQIITSQMREIEMMRSWREAWVQ